MIYFDCFVQIFLLLGIFRILWVLKVLEAKLLAETDSLREHLKHDDKTFEVDLNRRLSELQNKRFSRM